MPAVRYPGSLRRALPFPRRGPAADPTVLFWKPELRPRVNLTKVATSAEHRSRSPYFRALFHLLGST